jgi:hypothetical protein
MTDRDSQRKPTQLVWEKGFDVVVVGAISMALPHWDNLLFGSF